MKPTPERYMAISEKMRKYAPGNCLGIGASDSEIMQCEQLLEVELPNSYKWFLKKFGYCHWPDTIYGLVSGWMPGGTDDIVNCAYIERNLAEPFTPHHLVPFFNDGAGNLCCLDTKKMSEGECPVVSWNHELDADQTTETVNENFLDWLEAKIGWELSRDKPIGSYLN